jgi:hypothetical protein
MKTIHFIGQDQVPADCKVTYGRIVTTICPQKLETHRVRLTVGDNLIGYPGDVSTPTADMTTAKILFNIVISTPDARFMCTDVKDFYLNTPIARFEYRRLPIHIIPPKLSTNTNSCLSFKMVGSTSKFGKGCMACPRPASSLTNALKST